MLYYIVCAVAGYLIGSIPFGYIIVKLKKGVDIRTLGSGNIGATNVGRVLGWPWGVLCFLLDATKGYFPTTYVFSNLSLSPQVMYLSQHSTYRSSGVYFPMAENAIAIGLGIILGHLFPLYIRFKGGKGVATALGVFFALTADATIMAFIIWVVFLLALRYVSFASIMAAISLPITFALTTQINFPRIWEYHYTLPVLATCIFVALLVIIRHIPNIKRLIAGTEPKVKLWGAKPQINTDEHK